MTEVQTPAVEAAQAAQAPVNTVAPLSESSLASTPESAPTVAEAVGADAKLFEDGTLVVREEPPVEAPPKRKGGWPKGKPRGARKGSEDTSAGPSATTAPAALVERTYAEKLHAILVTPAPPLKAGLGAALVDGEGEYGDLVDEILKVIEADLG